MKKSFKMKFYLFSIATAMLITSCGDDKLQSVLDAHKATDTTTVKEKEVAKDTSEIVNEYRETNKDSVVQLPDLPDAIVNDDYRIKFKQGVEATILAIIRNKYKLSENAENMILESLLNNAIITKDIDINIDEFVKIKVGELRKIGFIIDVNPDSPINISWKYKHVIVKGKDSVCLKKK